MIDGAPLKQALQAGIYKHHPRKEAAAWQSAEQQQKRGGFVLWTKGGPMVPESLPFLWLMSHLAPQGSLLQFEVLGLCPHTPHVLPHVLLCMFLIQSFSLLVWNRVVHIQS